MAADSVLSTRYVLAGCCCFSVFAGDFAAYAFMCRLGIQFNFLPIFFGFPFFALFLLIYLISVFVLLHRIWQLVMKSHFRISLN